MSGKRGQTAGLGHREEFTLCGKTPLSCLRPRWDQPLRQHRGLHLVRRGLQERSATALVSGSRVWLSILFLSVRIGEGAGFIVGF